MYCCWFNCIPAWLRRCCLYELAEWCCPHTGRVPSRWLNAIVSPVSKVPKPVKFTDYKQLLFISIRTSVLHQKRIFPQCQKLANPDVEKQHLSFWIVMRGKLARSDKMFLIYLCRKIHLQRILLYTYKWSCPQCYCSWHQRYNLRCFQNTRRNLCTWHNYIVINTFKIW